MSLKEVLEHHAEEIWFAVMLVLVATFSIWNAVTISQGTSTSYRYGLPLFSGLPKDAQDAVLYFQSHPPQNGYSEVVNGILVVNMTYSQSKGFIPNVIVANAGQPIVIILNSPDVIAGFYMRLQDGIINVNAVPGQPSYVYIVAPSTPGNYTWRNPEYSGYSSSYFTGTLVVK